MRSRKQTDYDTQSRTLLIQLFSRLSRAIRRRVASANRSPDAWDCGQADVGTSGGGARYCNPPRARAEPMTTRPPTGWRHVPKANAIDPGYQTAAQTAEHRRESNPPIPASRSAGQVRYTRTSIPE